MSELKENGKLRGISLVLHLMSNWRSILDVEYKCWKEQDEQAYKQIKAIITKFDEKMKGSDHSQLQASIDRIQENNDELTRLLLTLCQKLGDLIGYKHEKKDFYTVLISVNNEEYDVYDLIKQTEGYISASKKEG